MYMCTSMYKYVHRYESMYEYVHRYDGARRPKWEDRPSEAGVTGRCEHPNHSRPQHNFLIH